MAPILFLIDELEVGGSQRQILFLAKAMRRAGHPVEVGYFRADNAEMRPELEAADVTVTLVAKHPGIDAGFFLRLARFLAADRDRRVLTFGYTASLWARLAGARPVSCVRNLSYLPRPSKLLARLELQLSRRSRWVVANSQAAADRAIANGVIPRAKLLVIPNAVEAETGAPRQEAQARLRKLAGDGPMVGTLARLAPAKDLPTLMRAARLVVDRRPEVRFVVGGEGPERHNLEKLRHDLQLGDRFFLPGTLNGRDVIAGLDVAVMSSSAEGMSNFLLEAMAAKIPVVSTRAGATPDVLEDGRLGRLVAIGDHAALAEGILAALDDPAAVEAAAEKLRELSPSRIAQRYLALFGDRL